MNCELQGANTQNESIGEAVRKAENLGYSIFKSATAIKKRQLQSLALMPVELVSLKSVTFRK